MPQTDFVVVAPFADHAIGDVLTDSAAIQAAPPQFVVAVLAETPPPAASPPAEPIVAPASSEA